MEAFFPLVLVLVVGFLAWYTSRVQAAPIKEIASVEQDKPLPEHIPKPSQYPLHFEWEKEFYTLIRKTCLQHFGKDYCYNCKTQDTYDSCDCDGFTQVSAAGHVVAKVRLFSPSCSYHTKEHYFV